MSSGPNSKSDGYNAVGAGQMMKLGGSVTEYMSMPGGNQQNKPGSTGPEMMHGEATAPGGNQQVKPQMMNGTDDTSWAKPGGAQSISV